MRCETIQIGKNAYRLRKLETKGLQHRTNGIRLDASVEPVAQQSDGPLRFKGLANNGRPMLDHWYWGNMILDLEGGRANSQIYLMVEHYLLAGIIDKVTFSNEGILVEGWVDEDEEAGQELARRLKKKYPLQMSVFVEPIPEAGAIEDVPSGAKVKVNGHEFLGPGHIFREYQIPEASAVLFGFDAETEIVALSRLKGGPMPGQNPLGEKPEIGSLSETKLEAPDHETLLARLAKVEESNQALRSKNRELELKSAGLALEEDERKALLTFSDEAFTVAVNLATRLQAKGRGSQKLKQYLFETEVDESQLQTAEFDPEKSELVKLTKQIVGGG